jgi:hypothetical protein
VNNDYFACAISVGVTVDFEGCAVGSPAGVADADLARHVIEVYYFVDFVDFALVFFDFDFSVS